METLWNVLNVTKFVMMKMIFYYYEFNRKSCIILLIVTKLDMLRHFYYNTQYRMIQDALSVTSRVFVGVNHKNLCDNQKLLFCVGIYYYFASS